MTLNQSKNAEMELRRSAVASLRLRGLTLREIALQLPKQNPPIINHKTGEAYSHITVKNDLEALKAEWHEVAMAATNEHISRQFSELQELKKAAWSGKNPALALKALEAEMKLLGTMKQPGIQIDMTLNINIELVTRLVTALQAQGWDANQFLERAYERVVASAN